MRSSEAVEVNIQLVLRMALPQSQHQYTQKSNPIALGMIGGAFVSIMAFTSPFVFMQLRSALPYMATPRNKVEKALKFISRRICDKHSTATGGAVHHTHQPMNQNAKQQLNFVDLGSGDGTTILASASLGWRSTGLELNPSLWLFSSIRRILCSSKKIRQNSQFVLGDMFANRIAKERLNQADCVMIFGVKPLMPMISELVQSQCKAGCYLMSYRFRVPLLNEKNAKSNSVTDSGNEINKSLLDADLIYDEEEMRIYELNGHDNKTTSNH